VESIETFQKRGALEEFEFRQFESTYEYVDWRLVALAACFYNSVYQAEEKTRNLVS
jgi:hypothetical protein